MLPKKIVLAALVLMSSQNARAKVNRGQEPSKSGDKNSAKGSDKSADRTAEPKSEPVPASPEAQTEFAKHIPLRLYDADAPAWDMTLEPNGVLRAEFRAPRGNSVNSVVGGGKWEWQEGLLVIERHHRKVADPADAAVSTGATVSGATTATGAAKPTEAREHLSRSEYSVDFKEGRLTVNGVAADAKGLYLIPPR